MGWDGVMVILVSLHMGSWEMLPPAGQMGSSCWTSACSAPHDSPLAFTALPYIWKCFGSCWQCELRMTHQSARLTASISHRICLSLRHEWCFLRVSHYLQRLKTQQNFSAQSKCNTVRILYPCLFCICVQVLIRNRRIGVLFQAPQFRSILPTEILWSP